MLMYVSGLFSDPFSFIHVTINTWVTLNVIFWSQVVTGSHWIKGLIFSYIVKFIGSLCYIGSLTLLNFTYASILPFIALVLWRENRGHWTFFVVHVTWIFRNVFISSFKTYVLGWEVPLLFHLYVSNHLYLKYLILTEKLCTIDIHTIIWEGQKMSIIQIIKKRFQSKVVVF